eukprot:sb/3471287/
MSLPGMIHSIAVISRIGRVNPEKARAIRVIFKKEADAVTLLRLSKQPRHRIRRKGVFVCQYYSEVEMKEFYRKQKQKARKEKEGEFVPAKNRKEREFVPTKIRKEGDFVPAKKERAKKTPVTPNPLNSKNIAMEETEMESDPDLPGCSGERVLPSKLWRPVYRGEILLISYTSGEIYQYSSVKSGFR